MTNRPFTTFAICIGICLFGAAVASTGTTVANPASAATFSKDVAPIFYAHCVECHRPGEVAPMSLITYRDARPWARSIKEKVVTGVMPPWLASPGHGHFSNDRRLTPKEISTIAAWVDAGAPEGDVRQLPPAPTFVKGWNIGTPDVVFRLQKPVAVPASGVIPYMYFTVPTGFTEDKWVQAAEIRADNRSVVHHIIVFVRDPKSDSDPETGRIGQKGERGFKLAGFAPGEQPKVYPAGMAKLIKAGSNLVFQVHYTTNGKAAMDQSYVGLIFAKEPVHKIALTGTATNSKFVIPPGDPNYEAHSSWTAPADVRILDLMPHMHFRGKDFTYTAVYPDGRSEIILQVPKYDFNWQLVYRLNEPLFLPKGSRLDCEAHFDNSASNKYNPDPSKEVRWGPQTWEEMMIGWFDYVVDKQEPGEPFATSPRR
ncbi:MAG TPA: cytochrome c [Blastocatellia bacterium]|nr:cytochrome c [Blastocatellia bacterium]